MKNISELQEEMKLIRIGDATLHDYYMAPSLEGKRTGDWQDKPHRLIYDLVEFILKERETP